MTSSPSLARWLARRVEAERKCYRKLLKRCQRSFSKSAVHDLRVETRRLLALLDLLRALDSPGPLGKSRKLFKRRLDAFDDIRDTHVQLSLLKSLRHTYAAALLLEELLCRRERCLTDQLRKGVSATRQTRAEHLLRKVRKRLCDPVRQNDPEETRSAVTAVLRDAYERVVACRNCIRPNQPSTVHRTRIAFKRFRYMCELLRPFLGAPSPKQLKRMREYQALMGEIQDLQVLLAGLRRATAEGKIGARALGSLHRELLERREELISRFISVADRLFQFNPANFGYSRAATGFCTRHRSAETSRAPKR